MAKYWFKPHRYGYGATATTWQAWAFTLAAIVALVICTLGVVFLLRGTPWVLPGFIGATLLVTGPYLWFCRKKTDGEWRWRWGDEP